MNRKRLGFILIGAGVALAFVVGALVYIQVNRAREIEAQLPTRRVILATEDIPGGSQIQAKQIQLFAVPDQAIPANASTDVDSVVSKFTPATIYKGQVVISTQIGVQGDAEADVDAEVQLQRRPGRVRQGQVVVELAVVGGRRPRLGRVAQGRQHRQRPSLQSCSV